MKRFYCEKTYKKENFLSACNHDQLEKLFETGFGTVSNAYWRDNCMANSDRAFSVLDDECATTTSTPRPHLRRGASNDERSNPSLSLKWEDFFGTSLDLTSGILNALDTISDVCNGDVCQEENDCHEVSHAAAAATAHQSHLNEECEFYNKGNNRQACSSPTDIVLLNALPTIPKRHFIGGCRSSATVPAVANNSSTVVPAASSSASAFTTFPRTLRASSVRHQEQQLLQLSSGTTSKLVESGYVSEETMLAAVCSVRSSLRNENGGSDSNVNGVVLETGECTPPPSLLSSASATLDKASRVLQELVETERSYVSDLSLLVEGYMEPMQSEARFLDKSVSIIFGVLPNLWQFHEELLAQLNAAFTKVMLDNKGGGGGGYSAVAQCFLDNRQRFHHYSHYCTNFPRSLSHLQELLSDAESADFFLTRQKVLQQMLPLQTFLLKPVQRILKYHLLLQNLVKVLGEVEPELEKAALCMTNVAAHINELQRRHEHTMRVRQLQSLLKSAHVDLAALGELVLEDTFRLCGKKGARQVFLFDKAMLSGKRLENGMLAIKEVIRCANLMLIESIPKEPLSFHVLPFDNPKAQQTLQARTLEQKRRWCHQIKRLILENYKTTIPEKAKNKMLSMAASGADADAIAFPQKKIDLFGEANYSSSTGYELDEDELARPVSSCCDEDLVTLHEEAWQELLRRNVYTCEHDSISSSSSQNSDLVLYDDLRCLAVEINEERLCDSTAGFASNILRATIDSSLKYKSASSSCSSTLAASKTKTASVPSVVADARLEQVAISSESTSFNTSSSSANGSSHNPVVYIHCPLRYDHLVFGKAYHEYIEKTMTMTALSPSDIDDIFKPLRELHVDVDDHSAIDCGVSASDGRNGGRGGGTTASSSQPSSSAESSPRHIVSRIATSSGNSTASVDTLRIIQVVDNSSQSEAAAAATPPPQACPSVSHEVGSSTKSTRQRKSSMQPTEKQPTFATSFTRSHSTTTPPLQVQVPLSNANSASVDNKSIRSTSSSSCSSTSKGPALAKVTPSAAVSNVPLSSAKCLTNQTITKDEPTEAPRRGTVANMISRFQFPS